MPNWLRALIAAYGAKKLGGGCFTILIFVVIYVVWDSVIIPRSDMRQYIRVLTSTWQQFIIMENKKKVNLIREVLKPVHQAETQISHPDK